MTDPHVKKESLYQMCIKCYWMGLGNVRPQPIWSVSKCPRCGHPYGVKV